MRGVSVVMGTRVGGGIGSWSKNESNANISSSWNVNIERTFPHPVQAILWFGNE